MATTVFKHNLIVYDIEFIHVKLLFYIFVIDCYMSLLLPLVTLS